MERVRQVVHRGKPIFEVDYSDLKDTRAVHDLIWESARVLQAEPANSARVLMIVRGARFDAGTVAALKEAGVQNKPHIKAVAVVGLSGLMAVINRAMRTLLRLPIPAFDTVAEAHAWLVDHE